MSVCLVSTDCVALGVLVYSLREACLSSKTAKTLSHLDTNVSTGQAIVRYAIPIIIYISARQAKDIR